MTYKDFVNSTMKNLDQEVFFSIKRILVGEYISFAIIPEEAITVDILAEKVCDYFEKLEIKTGKNFEKHLENYVNSIDSITGRRIAKVPQRKKNDDTPVVVPRARKYYERAASIKASRSLTMRQIIDYSRIMMCLYTSIIKNKFTEISSLDYSVNCIDPDRIITSMKEEKDPILGKVNKFNTKELYSTDTCTLIMTIIMIFKIINDQERGEYKHG